jgi:hypothetical protein
MVLADIGADDQALCAALLHDTLEDTGYTLAGLRAEFGAGVAGLVTGVAALDAAQDIESASAAGLAAQAADSRVLMIKLADRLHNMRTVGHLPRATQLRKSTQTLEVLAPLAGRLGLDAIRDELENLAEATLGRRGPRATSVSGRVLAATAVLLPHATRSRWRQEWIGELYTLPTRRQRVVFAARTMAGVVRLALTLRRPWRAGSTRHH